MKKAKIFIKNNIKLLIGLIIGIIISAGGVYAAIVIQGSSVGYTDNYSLGATTVQAAIDALYNKTKLGNDSKFIEAYTYNASTCVTGNESTCVATTCYKTKSANSCPAGTIIRYKVSPGNVVTFHVMYDDASTITMQAQRNTIYSTQWYTTSTSRSGPITVLTALENATAGWEYVNDQTYTMGTTVFKTTKWTQCTNYYTCTTNTYILESRTAKARLITVQEAYYLGCSSSSCPKWLTNYIYNSANEKDASHGPLSTSNQGYWTMTAAVYSDVAWRLISTGLNANGTIDGYYIGARAVVVVSK